MAPEAARPEGAAAELGFALLEVEGPIPFGAVGVLRDLADPLARAGVGIFATSTYDTDYLLVREEALADAVAALLAAGHRVAMRDEAAARGRVGRLVARSGFAVISRMVEPSTCEAVAAAIARWRGPGRAGRRDLLVCREVAALGSDPRLASLASEILGAPARALRATLFSKGPEARWGVLWHQDVVLPLPPAPGEGWGRTRRKGGVACAAAPASELERVVGLRIQLDVPDLDAGPLVVFPASHQAGVLGREQIDAVAARSTGVPCLPDLGGVVVLRPLAVHGSARGGADKRRWVLHLEYVRQSKRYS